MRKQKQSLLRDGMSFIRGHLRNREAEQSLYRFKDTGVNLSVAGGNASEHIGCKEAYAVEGEFMIVCRVLSFKRQDDIGFRKLFQNGFWRAITFLLQNLLAL